MTSAGIITAAAELTRQFGLENWTLRQLASALDAYPAVIYHHVGDRKTVVAAVIEHIVGQLTPPPADLPWRAWFEQLMGELRPLLRRYPGVARRLALVGPAVPSAMTIIDRGVRVLKAAGFGEESPVLYGLLLSQACQFVALEDDRDLEPGLRAEAGEVFSAHREDTDQPGLAWMGRHVHDAAAHRDQHYDWLFEYTMARVLDGVEVRLMHLRSK